MYYNNDLIYPEHGIHIEKFMPLDGHCDDCGSTNFVECSDPTQFEADLENYQKSKDDLLSMYNSFGILTDFELKNGYESFDKLKRTI